jgi:hypothetical protein
MMKVLALVCFFVALKFAAHGRTMNDGMFIGLGCAAFVAAVLFVVSAVRTGPQ